MKKDIIPFYNPSDKMIVRSEGCYLYDTEGKKYIDFESGVWCVNLGHGHPRVVKRMNEQSGEMIHHGYHFRNEISEMLSVKLRELTGLEKGASVFLSSGSEAVNLSITLARYFTGRKKILKIDNSYLSAYGFGQISLENEFLVNVKFNDPDPVREIDFSDIAAFVIETGGASVDMVRFPGKDFIKALTEACRKNDCLLIAEEVTTGMGRMAKWFGFQHYDFIPDMVVSGKALGNGYPVSAVTINKELAVKFEKSPFRYAQSHQNDPLGCSVALEVINILSSGNLIEKSGITGEYFRKELERLQTMFPAKIKETRARGLMLALEFSETTDGESISRKLFENGFVTGFKLNTLRFLPPLIISEQDINLLISKLEEILKED